MEVLRFTLSGKNAFFKKPEVNSYCYYTYGNIHKVALLGMFGAILGYGGYTQMKSFKKEKKQDILCISFPEFYEKLKDLKISILPVPEYKKGYIPKKIQIFNNSVGYASQEQGGNLIIREQWLENPKWEICLLIDSEEAKKVKEAICNKICVFYPYLGKNDHPADIKQIKVEQVDEVKDKLGRLDCFYLKDNIQIVDIDDDDFQDIEMFKYEEMLPYGMDGWVNNYFLKSFVYTSELVNWEDSTVYELKGGKKIVFY